MTCDCERCLYRDAAWHCETCDRFLCTPCAGLCGLDHDITGIPPPLEKAKPAATGNQLTLPLCVMIFYMAVLLAWGAALLIHARADSHDHDWRDEAISQSNADVMRLNDEVERLENETFWLRDHLDYLAFELDDLRLLLDELAFEFELLAADR